MILPSCSHPRSSAPETDFSWLVSSCALQSSPPRWRCWVRSRPSRARNCTWPVRPPPAIPPSRSAGGWATRSLMHLQSRWNRYGLKSSEQKRLVSNRALVTWFKLVCLKRITEADCVCLFVKTQKMAEYKTLPFNQMLLYGSKTEKSSCLYEWLPWVNLRGGRKTARPWAASKMHKQPFPRKARLPLSSSSVCVNKIKVNKSWHRRWALLNKLFIHPAAAFPFDLTRDARLFPRARALMHLQQGEVNEDWRSCPVSLFVYLTAAFTVITTIMALITRCAA